VTWSEHPSSNVTQYQIWRKVKHQQSGTTEGPTLLATVNRGTTSYTDYSYIVTSGYTDDLVSYDVRAYYSPTQTYSDPSWTQIFARHDIGPKVVGEETMGSVRLGVVPTEYAVSSYPNPFNPTTTIAYQLPEPGLVKLVVYDVLGREVATLVDEYKPAGSYSVKFDGSNLASGIYFFKFAAGVFIQVNKMLLAR